MKVKIFFVVVRFLPGRAKELSAPLYITFIVLLLQQWLHERASMLHYKCIACLVIACYFFRRRDYYFYVYDYLFIFNLSAAQGL